MPRSKIELFTGNGELVTEFELGRRIRVSPFQLWSIIKCVSREMLLKMDWPRGVEAEIVLVLAFHAHDTLRTTEIAQILQREVATVCRALRKLENKKLVFHVRRGEWCISRDLVYHGRWQWRMKHARQHA